MGVCEEMGLRGIGIFEQTKLMRKLIVILALVNSFVIDAQTITFGEDTSLCAGQEYQLIAPDVTLDSSMFLSFSSPDSILLEDDFYSDTIDIGFDFTFYDSTYSQVLIGQNGTLCFDLSKAQTIYGWQLSEPIPNNSNDKNSIFFPFIDFRANDAPYVFETIGVAPNRKFIVQIQNSELYGLGCGDATATVILNETNNEIEIHIGNKSDCLLWNNGWSTQGLHSRIDTISHAVPGRNAQVWSAFQEGKKFTPNGPYDYLLSDIPYQLAILDFELVWSVSEDETFPFVHFGIPFEDTITVTLDTTWQNTRHYYVGLQTMDSDSNFFFQPIFSDSSSFIFDSTNITSIIDNDFCESGLGRIDLDLYDFYPDSVFFWTAYGSYEDSLINLTPGEYEFTYREENGCYTQHSAFVENDTAFTIDKSFSVPCTYSEEGYIIVEPEIEGHTYIEWLDFPNHNGHSIDSILPGQYTLVATAGTCLDTINVGITAQSILRIENILIQDEQCFGAEDGIVDFDNNSTTGTSVFFDGVNSGSQTTFFNLSPGDHYITLTRLGCELHDTVTVQAVEIPLSQNVTPSVNSGENFGSAIINATGGTPPYQYSVGHGSQSSNEFQNLEFGEYECIVTDANGCSSAVTFTINQELSLIENSEISPIIFPNPANDFITAKLNGKFDLELIDTRGKVVYTKKDVSEKIAIPVGIIANGIYTVSIKSNQQLWTEKVVVNH